MKYIIGIIAAALLLIGSIYVFSNNQKSTNDDTKGADTEELSIVTSFYPLQFALERIVGDLGTVNNIGAGKDPHDFEPTTQDVLAMQKADVVVLQGADFETWGDDVTKRLEADNVPVVIATADLTLQEGGHHHEHEGEEEEEEEHDHEHGMYDPHTWLDPVLFSEMVGSIADKISAIDPKNASTYQSNAATLQSELAALDANYKSRLSTCALDEVITSHDAFSYLAKRYNFTVHSIAGLSTQDTPSAITLANLKEEAEEGIGTILLEKNSIAAYGETLARETGLQTLSINPISFTLTDNEDYFNLMQKNLDSFTIALECKA